MNNYSREAYHSARQVADQTSEMRRVLTALNREGAYTEKGEQNFTEFKMPAFYVYEDKRWMAIICLKENQRLTVREALETDWMKHSDDYWFLKHALEHPARVSSPEKAEMFVVGGLLNLIVEQPIWSAMKCCIGSMCDGELIQDVEDMLLHSSWFNKSQGRNHVLVASHYESRRRLQNFKSISTCNWISFEHNELGDGRAEIASTYVGRKCPPANKTHDLAFIAKMKNREVFPERHDACRWLNETKLFRVSTCGQGQQCPALAQARMGLHIRGDTFGSNRLMDMLTTDTVPVVTQQQQYHILPPFFPWRKMTVFAPLDSKEHFFDGLKKANISTVQSFNAAKRIAYKLDWRHNYLFEQYIHAFWILSERITWKELLLNIGTSRLDLQLKNGKN